MKCRPSLPQQMAKVFEDALAAAAPGPVAEEMKYCFAEQLWSEGKAEQVSVIALVMLAFVFVFRFLESRIVRRSELS